MIPNKTFGILTHAFVSNNFKKKFSDFPRKTALKYFYNSAYESDESLSKRIVKFVDSGIFKAEKTISYQELFKIYDQMNAHYGAIVDFLKDKEKTVRSAKEAIKIYNRGKHKFKLVGIAQGNSIEDYLWCYERLKDQGYRYIAIGGLLTRNGNSNYIGLRCENFLIDLVYAIKEKFNPNWIFTFGIFNPKRKQLLENLGVWGADYKGWLFHYDESYSFLEEYEYKDFFVSVLLKHYKILKQNYRLNYSPKDVRKIIKLERQLLDKSLKTRLSISLQELRFRRIRDELYKVFVLSNNLSE